MKLTPNIHTRTVRDDGIKKMEGQNENEKQLNVEDYELAQKYFDKRREWPFRWGTRCLRGGGWNYNPCVFDRTGWSDYNYLSFHPPRPYYQMILVYVICMHYFQGKCLPEPTLRL